MAPTEADATTTPAADLRVERLRAERDLLAHQRPRRGGPIVLLTLGGLAILAGAFVAAIAVDYDCETSSCGPKHPYRRPGGITIGLGAALIVGGGVWLARRNRQLNARTTRLLEIDDELKSLGGETTAATGLCYGIAPLWMPRTDARATRGIAAHLRF